jgi:hypothetical protein
VVQASDVQVYGNEFYNLRPLDPADGGHAIQINADGADGVGKPLSNILVYNNLFYGNAQHGISVHANKASIANLRVMNNTIVGNQGTGFRAGAYYGNTVTITSFKNNIIANNGRYAIDIGGAVSFGDINNNDYFGSSSALFKYQDRDTTWDQWRGLGFDAQGMFADPRLDQLYRPTAGSPVLGAGAILPDFNTDKTAAARVGSWDIGAFQLSTSLSSGPNPPVNVRVEAR